MKTVAASWAGMSVHMERTTARSSAWAAVRAKRSLTSRPLRPRRAKLNGEPIATPTLYILAESSAEGTAGEVLLDPSRCCVWPAADCD